MQTPVLELQKPSNFLINFLYFFSWNLNALMTFNPWISQKEENLIQLNSFWLKKWYYVHGLEEKEISLF